MSCYDPYCAISNKHARVHNSAFIECKRVPPCNHAHSDYSYFLSRKKIDFKSECIMMGCHVLKFVFNSILQEIPITGSTVT